MLKEKLQISLVVLIRLFNPIIITFRSIIGGQSWSRNVYDNFYADNLQLSLQLSQAEYLG